MKILILSNATWDTRNSLGNTLSNWFENWEDAEISFIYSRDALPNCNCCNRFLSVSPIDIIKNLFHPWRIGHQFVGTNNICASHDAAVEEKVIATLSGIKRQLVLLASDFLYSSKIWFNKKVRDFIDESQPDLVFMFSIPDAFRFQLLKYIKQSTKAKIVQFIADDVYGATYITNSILDKIHRRRYHKVIALADKLYGASEQMCEKYQKLFNKSVTPLYKGCDLEQPKKYVNSPLTIVYAGNLLYGREESLIALSKAILEINNGTPMIQLRIFSGNQPSKEFSAILNSTVGLEYCGRLPYEEIKVELSKADLVLHVESFESQMIQLVKYSFSTKIIDCLQSGTVMFVIGPKGIASVEYAKKIHGAIVVEKYEDILTTLQSIICNPHELVEMAKLQTDYAIKYHSLPEVQKSLRNDFLKLLEKE